MIVERAPGWACARFDRRGVVWTRVGGAADLERGDPVAPSTRFRWYSVTKLISATAVMQLVDTGAMRLDERVEEAGGATIRELLAHGAGLPDPWSIGWVRPPDAPIRSSRALTQALLAKHARRRVRGEVRYTNLGYLVLGERVAACAGRPFDEHVRDAILAPARMSRTDFTPRACAVGHEPLSARAAVMTALFAPHTHRLVRYVRDGWIGLTPFALEGQAYGGLVGSLDDLVRFGRLHLRDGELDGARVIEETTARAMRAPENARFGLGFERYDGGWIGHDGEAGGYRATLRLHPQRGEGFAALASSGVARFRYSNVTSSV